MGLILSDATFSQASGTGPIAPEELRAANINPNTYLATDYLNHFNEVAMLIELLPMDEEVMADITAWQPVDYKTHFARTNFKGRDLAAQAYDCADPELRQRFDALVSEMDQTVLGTIATLEQASADEREMIVFSILPRLRDEISQLMGLINGECAVSSDTEDHDAQSAIDELFG